jgi:superfamily II DNA or RNA helicase
MTDFYRHQTEALEFMKKNTFASLFAPTGTGKGTIIEEDIYNAFHSRKKKGKIRIAVVVTHRILLSQQLLQRVVEYYLEKKEKPAFTRISVHSGRETEFNDLDSLERMLVAEYGDIKAGSSTKLEEEIAKCINLGKDIAISTTYQSLAKVRKVLKDLGIKTTVSYLDEIHRGVANDDWFKTLEQYVKHTDRCYGLTATPGRKRGRIVSLLGKANWTLDMSDALARGLICKPRWMVVEVEGNRALHMAQGVTKAFTKFEEHTGLECKMLVHCFSSREIETIAESKYVKALYAAYPDLMIAEISSERGPRIDGIQYDQKDRQTWIDRLKTHTGRMIVLHIDICNSGIDVPGFNFPLWTYWSDSETYVIQGNGRGARLDLEDRKMLEQGLITTEDLSTWKKPYNTVGILFFEDSIESDRDEFIDFIIQSREQGFDPKETIYSGTGSSTTKPNPFGKNVAKKPQRQSALEVAVNVHLEQRLAQEELERIRNMSSDQRTQALLID